MPPFFETKILEATNKIADLANPAPVLIDDGTLLGLIRDQKIIEWDTDIDLSVPTKGMDRILGNLDQLADTFSSVRLTYIDGLCMTATFISEDQLPISLKRFTKKGNTYYALTAPSRGKKRSPRIVKRILNRAKPVRALCEKKKEISNTKITFLTPSTLSRAFRKYVFWTVPEYFFNNASTKVQLDSQIVIPNNPEKYLETHYGTNWREPRKDWSFLDDDNSLIAYNHSIWKELKRKISYA